MYDKTHIGLVDTHTEGDGRHNHINVLAQERVLVGTADSAFHSSMIGQGLNIIEAQHFGQFLDLLAAQAVDDARLALIGLNELDNLAVHVLALGPYLIVEVGAVERGFEDGGFGHAQVFLDIVLHLGRRRCCQGDDRTHTDAVDNGPDIAVFRAKIMTPLRDTVCLVHSIERDGHILQEGHVLFLGKRLGSDIQQFGAPAAHVIFHFLDGLLGE